MSADIVVLGAGVIGASIAYHLARAGARVLVIERGPRAAASPGATWASAGGLRRQGRQEPERPLARMASARWPTLDRELDAWLETGFAGHLHVAESEAECEIVRARVEADAASGIDIELVQGNRLRALAPALAPTVIAGAYTAGDGQANPGRVAAAFLIAAQRLGASSRMATLARPHVSDGRVVGVSLPDGDVIACDTVVLATGAWGVRDLAEIGLVLPLRWRGLQMLLSEMAPPQLGPTVTAVGRNLSLKQGPSGQFMVGGRWMIGPGAEVGAVPRASTIPLQWQAAAGLLPAMAGLTLAQSWAGPEAHTIDFLPIIGPIGPAGLYAALGFSGHGFQISPAVGALVAEDVLGAPPALLAPFRPGRFATMPQAAVRAFTEETMPPC